MVDFQRLFQKFWGVHSPAFYLRGEGLIHRELTENPCAVQAVSIL